MTDIMTERSVQWFFQKEPETLAKILQLQLGRCFGTEVTTKFGRLDFMYQLSEKDLLVIELETAIDSSSKLEHCTEQVERYLKLGKYYKNRELKVALVYARDNTPPKFQKALEVFCRETGVLLRSYSIQRIFNQYNKMVNQLNYTSGLSLGRAVALGVTSISWLKKALLPFVLFNSTSSTVSLNELMNKLWLTADNTHLKILELNDLPLPNSIPYETLKELFTSKTNFYVLKRLGEDFEMFESKRLKAKNLVFLTETGRRFRDEIYSQIHFQNLQLINANFKKITQGQRKLLLEILVNGNFTKIKVNIFHFLRFVHLTEGSWLPKGSTKLSKAECQYLNNIFKSSYNSRTLKDLIQQTCTFCEELGLVKRIPAPKELFDKLMFTSLGSRVYNHFELLLHMERERHQIPLQIENNS
jgi:hypothetical protein